MSVHSEMLGWSFAHLIHPRSGRSTSNVPVADNNISLAVLLNRLNIVPVNLTHPVLATSFQRNSCSSSWGHNLLMRAGFVLWGQAMRVIFINLMCLWDFLDLDNPPCNTSPLTGSLESTLFLCSINLSGCKSWQISIASGSSVVIYSSLMQSCKCAIFFMSPDKLECAFHCCQGSKHQKDQSGLRLFATFASFQGFILGSYLGMLLSWGTFLPTQLETSCYRN